MRRFRDNFRIYHLVVFLRGQKEPIDELCYSIKEVLRVLEEWEANPEFESVFLSIED